MKMVPYDRNHYYPGQPNPSIGQGNVFNPYPSHMLQAPTPPIQQQVWGAQPFQHPGQIPGTVPWQTPFTGTGEQEGHFLFKNPLEQQGNPQFGHQQWQAQGMPYMPMNPYPKNILQQKQKSGMNSVLNSFKSQDGSIDINKMVNTAGQAINAMSQASALLKGLGGVFKA